MDVFRDKLIYGTLLEQSKAYIVTGNHLKAFSNAIGGSNDARLDNQHNDHIYSKNILNQIFII